MLLAFWKRAGLTLRLQKARTQMRSALRPQGRALTLTERGPTVGLFFRNQSSRSVVEGHEERRRFGIHRGDRGQSASRTDRVKRDAITGVIIDRQKCTRRVDDDTAERENARCNGRPQIGGTD